MLTGVRRGKGEKGKRRRGEKGNRGRAGESALCRESMPPLAVSFTFLAESFGGSVPIVLQKGRRAMRLR
jgi:hypothetical protein